MEIFSYPEKYKLSIFLSSIIFATCLRATPFGSLAVVWSIYRREPKIIRILLLKPKMPAKQNMARYFPNLMTSSCQKINTLINQIIEFLNGKDIHFPLDMVRLDLCSAFQQKVLRAGYAIPRGTVSTYLLIAKHIGNPNGARAVGIALATNPFPIIIPCHRAIRSDGVLGGYQGGLKMKRALLKIEGV